MTVQTGNLRRRDVTGAVASSAMAIGLLMGVGSATANADVLDDIGVKYMEGAGGGQLSNFVKEALTLRALGFKPTRAISRRLQAGMGLPAQSEPARRRAEGHGRLPAQTAGASAECEQPVSSLATTSASARAPAGMAPALPPGRSGAAGPRSTPGVLHRRRLASSRARRKLLSILVCPQDRGPPLLVDDEFLYNPRLRRAYRIEDVHPGATRR